MSAPISAGMRFMPPSTKPSRPWSPSSPTNSTRRCSVAICRSMASTTSLSGPAPSAHNAAPSVCTNTRDPIAAAIPSWPITGTGRKWCRLPTWIRNSQTLGLADRPILIMKIDVEGYEPEVVAGAKQALARAGVVVVEHSPGLSQAGGLSYEGMLDQLYASGLTPYVLEWTSGPKRAPSVAGLSRARWM